jgi:hypothetical protein
MRVTTMSQTIDVTGLPPDAIQAVESLVRIIRERSSKTTTTVVSVFDLLGKAPALRTGEDIAKQIEEERAAWGDR